MTNASLDSRVHLVGLLVMSQPLRPAARRTSALWFAVISCCAVTAAFPNQVSAQSVDTQVLQDINRIRSDALTDKLLQQSTPSLFATGLVLGAGNPSQVQAPTTDYRFILLAPYEYNSNIGGQPPTSSWHGIPELEADGEIQFHSIPLKLYGALDTTIDRYVDHPDADSDSASADLRATIGNGDNDLGWKGLLEYSPNLSFSPTFSTLQTTANTFSGGVSKAFGMDNLGNWLADGESLSNASYSLVLQADGGRTLSTGVSASFWKVQGEFVYQITFQWAAQFSAVVMQKYYDANMGVNRRDLTVTPSLTIAYVPELSDFGSVGGSTTQTVLGSPEIDVEFRYVSNQSNVASHNLTQWNLGPIIHATWSL